MRTSYAVGSDMKVEPKTFIPADEVNTMEDSVPEPVSQNGKCSTWCHSQLQPLLSKHNPLPTNPTFLQKVKFALLCPPHGTVSSMLKLYKFVLM